MTDQKQASRLPGDEDTTRDPPEPGVSRIRGNDVVRRAYEEGVVSASTGIKLQEYTVERDEGLPLRFKGYVVGWNSIDSSTPRGTKVTIYTTRTSRIITAVHQWQIGERRRRERHAVAAHDNADDALAWLIEDGGGQLGKSSREAWQMACQVCPALQGRDVEVID